MALQRTTFESNKYYSVITGVMVVWMCLCKVEQRISVETRFSSDICLILRLVHFQNTRSLYQYSSCVA